jgi:hypothetical protein
MTDDSTPFLLTIQQPPDGPDTSAVFRVRVDGQDVKLIQSGLYSCVKGHKITGFDIKWCPICREEWLILAFPITKEST